MKIAKKLVCALLVICMVFGIMLIPNGALRVSAATAPTLPLTLDFESETVGAYPTGWTDHPDVVNEAPNTSEGVSIVDEGNGNKCMLVSTGKMPNALNYHARYEFQPTDSILLKYRFLLQSSGGGAYLPFPLYTGMDEKSEYRASPLQPMIVNQGGNTFSLYYGYADWKLAPVKEGLLAGQWYELVMLVDLKTDTRKMYLDGEQLDLSTPQSVDVYEDKSKMTMDRISVGAYFNTANRFLVDDIEIMAKAKVNEVFFSQNSYDIRVNSILQLKPDFKPLGADPCGVTYASADPSVATVDANGLVKGVKEGRTTITVTPDAQGVPKVTLNITVGKEMTGTFSNVPDTLNMPLRGHMILEPQLTLGYAGDNTVEIISADPTILSVDEWNEIYALKEGQTKLILRAKDYPTVVKEIPVTVKKATVAKTIYVAPNGTGDGLSKGAPTTLDKALTILEGINKTNMTGNIEVVLADGYYYRTEALQMNEKHGGNNLYSVVFKADEGANPTIGGALHIAGSSFKKSDIAGVYVADVPEGTTARQLYVNNIRATRAKTDGLKNAELFTNMFGQTPGIICDNTELLNCANPANLEIVWYSTWTHQRVGVKQVKQGDDGKVQLIMDTRSWKWANESSSQTAFHVENITQIENALILLDEPGEWYLDEAANKLYYMPRGNENMSKVTVTIPALDVWDQVADGGSNRNGKIGLVNIFGSDLDKVAQNIHFEGITFADTTWTRPNTDNGHISNQSNYIRSVDTSTIDRPIDAAVNVRRANGVSFLGCTFTRIGSNAMWMTEGTKNSMFIGNHVFDVDGAAIQLGEPDYSKDVQNYSPTDVRRVIKNNDVLNNYIHNIGVDYHAAAAISVGFVVDLDISHNEIFDVPFAGIHAGYGWNNGGQKNLKNVNVSYNFIHDFMMHDAGDSGAFYAVGNTLGNNKIFNNYFRNQGNYVASIYFDQGSGYWVASNNVVDVSETLVNPLLPKTGIDWAYSAEDTHYITLKDNFYWDKDEFKYWIAGGKLINENNTLIADGNWPAAAQKIIKESGLEQAYAGLRNNQIERLYTNLNQGMVTVQSTFDTLNLNTDDANNKTFQIKVTATDGKDQPITLGNIVSYSVEDKTVAHVSRTGLVTALKAGETVLYVYVNSNNVLKTIQCNVVVTGETVETAPTEVTEATEATEATQGNQGNQGNQATQSGSNKPGNPPAGDENMLIIAFIAVVGMVTIGVILLPKKKASK